MICINLIFFFILFINRTNSSETKNWLSSFRCPCGSGAISDSGHDLSYRVCIEGPDKLEFKSNLLFENKVNGSRLIISRLETSNKINCDAIIKIFDKKTQPKRHSCPAKCQPIPVIEVSKAVIFSSYKQTPLDESYSLTCSLTVGMFWKILDTNSTQQVDRISYQYHLLLAMVERRIMECNEQSKWHSRLWNTAPIHGRRTVRGVVVWIGGSSRKEVGIDQQAVLSKAPFQGPSSVIGWVVDDDLFPCRNGSTRCLQADRRGIFKAHMPLTQLGDIRCDVGWGCAQRRPLRALAHVLLLFDPQEFIFLGDDDTYLNYDFFLKKFGSLLQNEMTMHPIILGNFLLPRAGQLSAKGFFLGGAGYVIGRAAIEALESRRVLAGDLGPLPHKGSAKLSHELFLQHLSLFREGKAAADIACPGTCFLSSIPDDSGYIPLGVRLIDLCTNLLAGEHTCHHSDHSVSRCLFYGLPAIPKGYPCFPNTEEQRANVPLMCGHIIDCNLTMHISCHRWKPVSPTDVTPVRTYLTVSNSTEWTGCLPAGDKKIWR